MNVFILPRNILQKFISVARENKVNGKQVETLAYFLGKNGKIDTILFPIQNGTASSVIDQGEKFYFIHMCQELNINTVAAGQL